jgi:hypothetical protein
VVLVCFERVVTSTVFLTNRDFCAYTLKLVTYVSRNMESYVYGINCEISENLSYMYISHCTEHV